MNRAIRVLELRSVRGTGGGPEKTIFLGAAASHRSDLHVTVCYLRDQRDPIFEQTARAEELGIEYVEIEERHSLDPRIWPALRTLVRERRIDIVHAHEYKTDLLALLLARRTGIIPLATAHGWTGQSPREQRLYYPVDKRLLKRFPRVIAVSSEIKTELVRHGANGDRITVILNAIDPVAFRRESTMRNAIRAELGYSGDEIVVGAVGRVERQKRFDLLLEAMAPLLRSRDRLRVAIVGDGSLVSDLEAQARALGISERCAFLGHRSDIARLHHAFDLFVQSSEYEGTPNAVLEAMAMETPLVATDVGGTKELALPGVHALIVPKHDVSALRQAIAMALDDSRATDARMRAARSRIENELSFAARNQRLETIYGELVAQRDGIAPSQPQSAHA